MDKVNFKFVFILFAFFIVIPIIYTLATALFVDGSFIDNVSLLNKETFLLLTKSCIVAFSISLFSTLFGTTLGFLLFKTNIKFHSFFKIVLLLPLFISPYILAVAWKDFFTFFFSHSSFISSYLGVVFVLTTIYTPLSMLIVGSALSNTSSQLEEAGFIITNVKSVIFKITLPIVKPALITSFVLVFILSISEFSVPAFLGVKVFTTEIFTQFSAFYNHSLSILQSILLISICIILLFAERKHLTDAPFFAIGSKGASNKLFELNNRSFISLSFVFFWLFVSIIFPFLILLFQSLKAGTNKLVKAFELLVPTFSNSIGLAFLGAVIILLVGFSSAYLSTQKANSKVGNTFDWLLLFVFAIPSTIFGISLIKFYNQPQLDFIYSSYAIIIIGYVGKFSFISSKIISNAIKQIPTSLFDAAQIEGVKPFRQIQKLLIPLIFPSLFGAFIISLIFSLGELGTTIMLYPPGTEIMPIKVFTIMANAPQALTSSMTLIVFTTTLIVITGFFFVAKLFLKKYNYNYDRIK